MRPHEGLKSRDCLTEPPHTAPLPRGEREPRDSPVEHCASHDPQAIFKSSATRTSCGFVRALSLLRSDAQSFVTVLYETDRAPAISAILRPRTSSRSTLTSRR